MISYLSRRLASGLLLILALTTLTYAVFRLIPTRPECALVSCGPGNHTTPAQLAAAHQKMGLDRPFVVQYGEFVWDIVRHGELRTFRVFSTPLQDTFTQYAPVTLSLVLGGAILLVLLALPLGAASALRPHGLFDRGVLAFSVLGLALHPFVVGLLLRSAFAQHLHIAPDGGYCGIRASPTSACGGLADWIFHLYLPWICFAIFFLPVYTRMFRTRVLQTLGEPFVRTARAKGASESRVLRAHVLRNAALPILPMLAMDVGTAITIAIYVETIFNIHGLGSLAVSALSGEGGYYSLDGIMRVVFVAAVAVVVLNLVADVALVALDPRITGRSGSRPMWRTEQGGLHRRRIALAFAVVAAAAAAGSVAAARSGGDKAPAGVPFYEQSTAPVQARWTERVTSGGYTLGVRIERILVGPNGWAVRARVVNRSGDTLALLPSYRRDVYSGSGFSLTYLGETAGGYHTYLRLPAAAFEPALPAAFAPGGGWHGTFAGPGKPPRHVQIGVGFGPFQPANGGRSLTIDSTKTFTLP